MKEKEREKESHGYEKKAQGQVTSIIIDSWMFPIEEKHPIRGVAIEESAKVSLSLSLSLSLLPERWRQHYLKTHRWDI